MEKTPIIAGNWKLHKTIRETVDFIEALLPKLEGAPSHAWIAPPFTAIRSAYNIAEGSQLLIGAQNISEYEQGAYTGEVSAPMVKEAGASFVLLGHSERRTHFYDTGPCIHCKLKMALAHDLTPILCIGESLKEREQGTSLDVLRRQLDEAIGNLTIPNLIVAYEPIWAIGTGKSATPEMAQEAHAAIRAHLGTGLHILYGGSVKPSNIASLLAMPDIDGALVGGASLQVEDFINLVFQGKTP